MERSGADEVGDYDYLYLGSACFDREGVRARASEAYGAEQVECETSSELRNGRWEMAYVWEAESENCGVETADVEENGIDA